jgi:hypothetical protein
MLREKLLSSSGKAGNVINNFPVLGILIGEVTGTLEPNAGEVTYSSNSFLVLYSPPFQ